jgi:hypothetical protein
MIPFLLFLYLFAALFFFVSTRFFLNKLIDGYVIYINIFLKAPEQDDFATIGRVM